jgi:disulfide bond formation protein DsbB
MTTTRPLDKILTGLAFVLGLATILGALGSQYLGGLQPCALCLEQRLPYYWGLPLLALILVFWNRLPLPAWYMGMGLVTALFAWGTYLGVYHAGVEWGFWPGPTACSGTGIEGGISLESLSNLQPIIGCDVVQFRFLGISLAGYNALISGAITILLIVAMVYQYRRKA